MQLVISAFDLLQTLCPVRPYAINSFPPNKGGQGGVKPFAGL